MLSLEELLNKAVEMRAADIFVVAGTPLSCRVNSEIIRLDGENVMPADAEKIILEVYEAADRDINKLRRTGDDDFSFSVRKLSRFRVSTYKQRGSLASVIRVIPFGIPDYTELGVPENVMRVASYKKGLVLMTGPAGGGKSTTLACVIDRINSTRSGHIITLEEPIEFLHKNKRSIVSQREIELDTENYVSALRACLRQSPDVILVGEMRDYETIRTAMTAAETGHLVISSLHTVGAASTIDRVIDVFPPEQQQQIRVQLAMLLEAVISQQLVPAVSGGRVPAFEIMNVNNAVKNMIREQKIHQIDSVIASSAADGMVSMDAALLELLRNGIITRETAVKFSMNPEVQMRKTMSL